MSEDPLKLHNPHNADTRIKLTDERQSDPENFDIVCISSKLVEKLQQGKFYDVVGEWNGNDMRWTLKERNQ